MLVTLTAFLILCKLGFWQLERASEKQTLLDKNSKDQVISIEQFEQISLQDLNLQDLSLQGQHLRGIDGKKITLKGDLNNQEIWLIDNKVFNGQVGYSVLVPFTLTDLEAKPTILLDLGWWPGMRSRDILPDITLPKTISATGLIKASNFEQFTLNKIVETASDTGNAWPKRIQTAESALQFYSQLHSAKSVHLPIIIYAESNTIDEHQQLYKPVVMPPEKHVAYAVQWFLIAFASLVIFIFASRIPTKKGNNHES